MRRAIISIAVAATLTTSAALAENWVVVDDDEIGASVDHDSIRRGSDNLVYFTAEFSDKSDDAVDCQAGVMYTLKLYAMDGISYPNWREDGRAIVPDSPGDAVRRYVCANVR